LTRLLDQRAFALTMLMSSLLLLVVASGLLSSLLGIRAHLEGFAVEYIGLMGTAYFGGYVLASLKVPSIVGTIGNIRTFAGFAALASVSSLAHLFWISPLAWFVLRASTGFCYAGMIIVVEGWLNGTAQKTNRGRLFAIYSITFTGAWALSQQLLRVGELEGFRPFILAGMIFTLALVPITLGRTVEPGMIVAHRITLRRLYGLTPIGMAGALVSGFCAGAFIGLGPVFAGQLNHGAEGVSLFMSVTILGALVMHGPVGILSDRFDRRKVIIALSSVSAAVSLLVVIGYHMPFWLLLVLGCIFGGSTFSLYALSAAHVNDHIEPSELVPTAGQLILVYGFGAMAGPFISGVVMGWIGPAGLFASLCAFEAVLVVFCLYRLPKRLPVPEDLKMPFLHVPRTSHAILGLLRRYDDLYRKNTRG